MPARRHGCSRRSARRRASRGRGEIKGHRLSARERRLFFDLYRALEAASVSVVCSRRNRLGGWAFSQMEESRIWQAMVRESVMHLCAGLDMRAEDLRVTPDSGRYPREVLAPLERRLEKEIARGLGARRVTVECADSQRIKGLQIADVIANLVLRSERGADGGSDGAIVQALLEEGRLRIAPIALEDVRPNWMR